MTRNAAALVLLLSSAAARGEYHLTARPRKPLEISAARCLDVIEGFVS